MRIEGLFDNDLYIKMNDLKEVTSQSIYKSFDNFNPEGLFSEEIFGQTSEERSYRCGYIKLPIHIFNQEIAKTIIQHGGGIIKKVAYAECKANLVNGVLVEAADGKYTGLRDLYNIWDQIDIEKTLNTKIRANINILKKSPKRLIFTDKIIVLPPEMRPIGMRNGKKVKSELNTIYMHILGLKSVSAHTTTTNVYQVYNQFQDAAISIYSFIQQLMSGKTGFLQKHLMSKTTLWTARNVISAPSYNSDDPPVGIYNTGYPLHTVISLFNPFIKFQMKQFFSYSNIQNIHPNKEAVNSEDLENIYDNKMIDELLRIYMENPGSRFRIMYLDPDNTKPIMFEAFDVKKNEKISRPLTLTDVCYICAKRAVVDGNKHVYTVRYPIGDYFGAFFTKVHLLSTTRTTHVQFNGEDYPYYPVVDPSMTHAMTSTQFADTITPSNSRLKAIGGDYDGDTVKSTGVWSDEANEQAEKLMMSKIYNTRMDGSPVYIIEIECLNGLYGLTKD